MKLAPLAERIYQNSYKGKMNREWFEFLYDTLTSDHMGALYTFLRNRKKLGKDIYPSESLLFNCFKYCTPYDVKVVIIGTDPYPALHYNIGAAYDCSKESMAIYSELTDIIAEYKRVKHEIKEQLIPKYTYLERLKDQYHGTKEKAANLEDRPKLENDIDNELESLGIYSFTKGEIHMDSYLKGWMSQGVLMINACRTSELYCTESVSETHWTMWNFFVCDVVRKLSELGGVYFYTFEEHRKINRILSQVTGLTKGTNKIDKDKGIVGSNFFLKCNNWLEKQLNSSSMIDWTLGMK